MITRAEDFNNVVYENDVRSFIIPRQKRPSQSYARRPDRTGVIVAFRNGVAHVRVVFQQIIETLQEAKMRRVERELRIFGTRYRDRDGSL